jgi:hypothetical protein
LIVRQLAGGSDTTFGNVSEYAWQDLPRSGRLLALVISAEDKTGNGAQHLKGEPAAPWIAKGQSFLEREQELMRLKQQRGGRPEL